MIQINLLPRELRRLEPTPWPKLLALLVSLIVILGIGLVAVYYRLNVLPTVIEERRRTEEEKKGLEARAKEADDLDKEIRDFELREKTIVEIRQARWLWAKILDQIVDVIPHYVQITSLSVKEAREARGKTETGPQIEMDCLSEGPDERNISRFRRQIMTSPLWEDVLDMPEWPYSLEAEDDKPVLKFKAIIVLKPKEAEAKAVAPPAVSPKPPRPS